MSRGMGLAFKRAMDVAGAAAGLVVLSPVLGGAALAVAWSMGRPVLFSHVRPGHKGRPFTLRKFRTMRAPRPGEAQYHTDEERLSPVGRFLRRSSVDELPELWNVLVGDMSLVGPRPLLMEYWDRYTPEQRRRHDMRPGITGWAQVNGRQTIKFSRRLELDIWYVDHWSIGLDLKILALTVVNVFRSSGVIPGQRLEEVDDLGLSVSCS